MKKTRLMRGILTSCISKPNYRAARFQRYTANRAISGCIAVHVNLTVKYITRSDRLMFIWIFKNVSQQRERLNRARARFEAPQHRPQSLIFAPKGPYRNIEHEENPSR